ncbi:hypothetical protein F3Y22_tig00111708pilonHSYRG00231 [Hibiscus syriacus]|uniref:Uncharacterized protein n=1 Tax=Hibiscus syriacus TaxID=106335 RepID=A0A6A2XHF0_HIBSY|nr:hypothetical protein F3Y22_tig00111708pilonHSYRG00231 [Hibiscus syriacus]
MHLQQQQDQQCYQNHGDYYQYEDNSPSLPAGIVVVVQDIPFVRTHLCDWRAVLEVLLAVPDIEY